MRNQVLKGPVDHGKYLRLFASVTRISEKTEQRKDLV